MALVYFLTHNNHLHIVKVYLSIITTFVKDLFMNNNNVEKTGSAKLTNFLRVVRNEILKNNYKAQFFNLTIFINSTWLIDVQLQCTLSTFNSETH